jgi:hypothetical protein
MRRRLQWDGRERMFHVKQGARATRFTGLLPGDGRLRGVRARLAAFHTAVRASDPGRRGTALILLHRPRDGPECQAQTVDGRLCARLDGLWTTVDNQRSSQRYTGAQQCDRTPIIRGITRVIGGSPTPSPSRGGPGSPAGVLHRPVEKVVDADRPSAVTSNTRLCNRALGRQTGGLSGGLSACCTSCNVPRETSTGRHA